MSFEIRTSPIFSRELKSLAKKYPSLKGDYAKLLDELAADPTSGVSIGRSCYKVRMAIRSKGKGKSGGARAVTYVRVVRQIVILLTVYDKSEKENLTAQELDHLIAQAEGV